MPEESEKNPANNIENTRAYFERRIGELTGVLKDLEVEYRENASRIEKIVNDNHALAEEIITDAQKAKEEGEQVMEVDENFLNLIDTLEELKQRNETVGEQISSIVLKLRTLQEEFRSKENPENN